MTVAVFGFILGRDSGNFTLRKSYAQRNLHSLLHIKINVFWEHKMFSLQIRKAYISSHVLNLITCTPREKDFLRSYQNT